MAQQQQQRPTQQAQQPAASSEVYILASTHHLGALKAQYKARLAILSARAVLILTLVGILGGIGILGYGFFLLSAHNLWTLLSVNSSWAFVGLILLCAGAWLAINALRYYGLCVYVFTEGLVRLKGDKADAVRWDQVKTIWQKADKRYISSFYLGTSHAYTVQRDDGKKFTFNDGLRNVGVLGETLIREVNSRLVPEAIATYNAGKPVVFGKLSVSIHGISNGEEIVLWNQVKGIQVIKGALAVNKEGQLVNWPSIRAAKTPNLPVFLALVDYVLKG